jgi:lysine biosynthesis protein LysW
VKCKECGSDYEVESMSKGNVKLKPAEVAEEDWGE